MSLRERISGVFGRGRVAQAEPAVNTPVIKPPIVVPARLNQEDPGVVNPEEQYRRDWKAFGLQREVVRVRTGVRELRREVERLVGLPSNLQEKRGLLSQEKQILVAQLKKPGHSRKKIDSMAGRKGNLSERIAQIPKAIEVAQANLARALAAKGKLEQEHALMEEAWVMKGGADRVVFYALNQLRGDALRREELFGRFSNKNGVTVRDLNARFNEIVEKQQRKVSGFAKVQPVIGEGGNRKRERNPQAGDVSTIVKVGTKATTPNSSTELQPKRREIKILPGIVRDPETIDDVLGLASHMRSDHQLSSLDPEHVWQMVHRLSSSDPKDLIHYGRVAGGPFHGWYRHRLSKNLRLIFHIENGVFIFRIGHRKDIYGTRVN